MAKRKGKRQKVSKRISSKCPKCKKDMKPEDAVRIEATGKDICSDCYHELLGM